MENLAYYLGKKTISGTFWSYFAYYSGKLMVLLSTIILARLLEKDDFGVAGYALVVTYELIDANTYKVHYDNGTCYTRYINAALTHARCNVFK